MNGDPICRGVAESARRAGRSHRVAVEKRKLDAILASDELAQENQRLRDLVAAMAERIYVQSNLLSRCAERARANSKKV